MPISYKLKVIAVGPPNSNKSFFFDHCLGIHDPYFNNSFKTVGVSLKIAKYSTDQEETLIMAFWDINGSQRFDFLFPTFFRGAAGSLLFFDASDFDKQENIEYWINKIRTYTNFIPIILIGTNKEERQNDVDYDVLRNYVDEFQIDDLFLLNQNDPEQCSLIFTTLANKLLENLGTKSFIEKLKSQLTREEKKLYYQFLEQFALCPICKKKNHLSYLNRFYFSKVPSVVRLRNSVLNLLEKFSNNNSQTFPKEITLGIPCCRCYEKIFTN
ncbi:MAG: hypothetical protein ACTSUN_02560 [Promethearchaeota archaeon]